MHQKWTGTSLWNVIELIAHESNHVQKEFNIHVKSAINSCMREFYTEQEAKQTLN